MPTRRRAALLLVPLLLAGPTACSEAAGGTALDRAQNGISAGTSAGGTSGAGGAGGTGGTGDPTADGVLDADDGFVPDGVTLSPGDDVPAIANLDPELRAAVQEAARAAADDGIDLRISSGWRSAEYQQALLDAAIAEHGSLERAREYVLTPEESEHVTGEAVDVGPTEAMYWMSEHGSDHGLCQTYGNEIWHYELATEPGTDCPPPLTDATHG